jgi:hypothetical protein
MSAVASLVTGTAMSRLIAEETISPAPEMNFSRTSSRIALTKIAIIMLAIPNAKGSAKTNLQPEDEKVLQDSIVYSAAQLQRLKGAGAPVHKIK